MKFFLFDGKSKILFEKILFGKNFLGGTLRKIEFFKRNRRPEKFSKKKISKNIFFEIPDFETFRIHNFVRTKILWFRY